MKAVGLYFQPPLPYCLSTLKIKINNNYCVNSMVTIDYIQRVDVIHYNWVCHPQRREIYLGGMMRKFSWD